MKKRTYEAFIIIALLTAIHFYTASKYTMQWNSLNLFDDDYSSHSMASMSLSSSFYHLNEPADQLNRSEFLPVGREFCRHVNFESIGTDTPRPNVNYPVYYLTSRFSDGTRRFMNPLTKVGCRLYQSKVVPVQNLLVAGDAFPYDILHRPNFDEHRTFLTNSSHASKRGGGYWFWKPLMILRVLQKIPDDSILVYSDPDRPDVLIYLADLIETMVQRNHDLAVEQWASSRERCWTKGDIFHHFNVSYEDPAAISAQYSLNFIVMQKNPKVIQLIQEWATLIENYHLVSDEPSLHQNHKTYQENRHDQSLLSMLLKVRFSDGGSSKKPFNHLDVHKILKTHDYDYNGALRPYTFRLKELDE